VLPEKARSLAQRTVQTLAPFFKQTRDGCGFVSELSLVSENDGERLVDAFTKAMNLRCVLLLSTDEFAHTLCPPGTPFRQKSMAPTPESQMPEQLGSHKSRGMVNFTMVPGLQVTKSNRRYLDYRGLSCLDGTLRLGAQCVTRAKVLVQRTSV
jgi:hypothetical protein